MLIGCLRFTKSGSMVDVDMSRRTSNGNFWFLLEYAFGRVESQNMYVSDWHKLGSGAKKVSIAYLFFLKSRNGFWNGYQSGTNKLNEKKDGIRFAG
jgi:hypothetical protein